MRTISGLIVLCGLVAAIAVLAHAPAGLAQDSSEQAAGPRREFEARGTLAPLGPPTQPPVRVEAGGSCVVDLRQPYVVSGSLSGSLEIDFRILVNGPCEVPPAPGKYDEAWIAHGSFTGALRGSAASGTVLYTADVRAGGRVEGRVVLGGGIDGELAVSGNFADGRLSYLGWARSGPQ